MTAKEFIDKLATIRSKEPEVPKKKVFDLAKEYMEMPVSEVVQLLKRPDYECRLGAVSILDWKARSKKVLEKEKEDIYKAYIDNHKWIDDWGLVDRAAPYVVGGYLFDKDRSPLYSLAKSKLPMERRTAIVSTYYFIRKNETNDTFNIAEMLVHDKDEYVQMAVGSWIREAGKKDANRLQMFLDKYAATMHRKCLRYAIEKMSHAAKQKYLDADKK
jgi:3-methyladenine DNA glycosylase AlkD